MIKITKKITMFLIVLMIITMPFCKVEAKTVSDLKKELASLQAKYNENKNKKNLTDAQIASLNSEISTINASITTIKNDIEKANKDIIDSQEKIDAKKEETDELLKFLQVSSGENVYLEYVFNADSYTDLIYRYSVAFQLTEHNQQLMNELTTLIEELENKKKELNSKNSELQTKSNELNLKVVTLRMNLEGYKEEGTTIEQDISDMKAEIKRLTDKGCKDNENIATCGRTSGNTLINAKGWTYPLKWGCVTSEYTGSADRTDWSGGGQHHGIDLDCVNEGTTVYAAAPGVVARVVERSRCGGNMVWVYHNVNGVPYTTVYMHLLRISVNQGQSVNVDTKVGEVGGGSTWYDYCSSGAHLHFGLAYGHNAYNFNANSFNPRNIINFPVIYYSGGGYFSR